MLRPQTSYKKRAIPLHLRAASILVAKRGIYPVVERIRARRAEGFILAFHSLPAEAFAALVEALEPEHAVSLDEIVDRAKHGRSTRGLFAITVDDGVRDTVRGIADVAAQRQWPVTFFLPTGYIEDREPMSFQVWAVIEPLLPQGMIGLPQGWVDLSGPRQRESFRTRLRQSMRTEPSCRYEEIVAGLARYLAVTEKLDTFTPEPIRWDEVTRLSANPLFTFESHGVTHTAVAALTGEELQAELCQSRDAISRHTGRECRHFCYPYGCPASVGTAAPAVVSRFYQSAVTMIRGRLAGSNPFLLPRVPLYYGDTPALARLKILTA